MRERAAADSASSFVVVVDGRCFAGDGDGDVARDDELSAECIDASELDEVDVGIVVVVGGSGVDIVMRSGVHFERAPISPAPFRERINSLLNKYANADTNETQNTDRNRELLSYRRCVSEWRSRVRGATR